MKYSIEKKYHSDFSVESVNKLKNRTYFIPFDSREQADKFDVIEERFNSPRVFVLNKNWKFKYYNSINDLPDIIDYEESEKEFADINVPSTWQRTGYEIPWYLNTRYQFKMRPPHIDNDVPVGVYHNEFVTTGEESRVIMTFLGVCSCIYLYVNGNFAGYAEGAHDMNEFDVTEHITQGINDVLIIVTKFCNGSYLECQDMFRENGIFRDVYVTEAPITDIFDFALETTKNNDGTYSAHGFVELVNPTPDKTFIKAELLDINNKLVSSVLLEADFDKNTEFKLNDLKVNEWSAEIPNLYKLFVSLIVDNNVVTCLRQFVGFKTVEIRGEVFLVNGQPVKLLGVNHHDTDAKNGWVMTPEQLLRDVKIMKEYNCNAVRMSHYPPDPILISLCDKYGLYVIDEADIECHNIYSNPLNQRFGRISNNMIWESRFIDRVDNMFKRDRNHPSIVMWSLGNEAGGYKCHDSAYHHLKKLTDIPVHYEGVIHTSRHSYDVISEMYPHTPKVKAIAEKSFNYKYVGKPYFLCEYAHAMGVGPGALDEYVNLFYNYDNLMGGCIWEFADHAVYDENAEYKYTYGGDHNEPKHDGNFCVDGLFHPDRTQSSGALLMKAVYRPITASFNQCAIITFKNRMVFKNADYIDCKWQLMNNGAEIKSGIISLDIAPQAQKDYDLGFEYPETKGDNYVVLTYIDKNTDKVIATEQITLTEGQYKAQALESGKLEMSVNKRVYTIKYNSGSIIYDANNGELVSYTVNNTELINQDPESGFKGLEPGIYRAEIDNDRFIKIGWKALGYDRSRAQFKRAKVQERDGKILINSIYSIKGFGNIAKCKIDYMINKDGSINVKVKMSKALKLMFYNDIPRCGVAIELPREFDNVEYYAYGAAENLGDMKAHTTLGIYSEKVIDMEEFYIMPQDNGNRSDARYVKLTNADNRGLEVVHDGKYFDFRVKHYALKNILGAKHIEDVKPKDTTVLYIDGFYRGAGSQSCGQQPLSEYRPSLKKPLEFSFTMRAVK